MTISFAKYVITACALLTSITSVKALPAVVIDVDASFEGLADSAQNPLTSGLFMIGWFNTGMSNTQITSLFDSGNYAAISSAFHEVAAITDLNSFGPGLPFESFTLVASGDTTAFSNYENALTGAAGKQIYGWILNSPTGLSGNPTQQAIVTSGVTFPTASDSLNYTDFENTFGTDSYVPGIDAVVGSIEAVTPGSGVDLNNGSPSDGVGANGGTEVLMTATSVPEPNVGFLAIAGLAIMALVRRLSLNRQN